MQGFQVVNLLIPQDPEYLDLQTPAGGWTLVQHVNFAAAKAAILGASSRRSQSPPVAETYYLENPAGMDQGAAACDRAHKELTPILLAATYATGLSVTIQRSTMSSDVQIAEPGDHWPRVRGLFAPSYIVTTPHEFQRLVAAVIASWSTAGKTEKALLLIHHWLDALSCWSMEDLYLSATTLLQIIVATEADRQGKDELPFLPGLNAAATRMGIAPLGPDVKNMRNELVHDGRLIGTRFSGPGIDECAELVAEVLNWFDSYMHVALQLGPVKQTRFKGRDFRGLNAYSIYPDNGEEDETGNGPQH